MPRNSGILDCQHTQTHNLTFLGISSARHIAGMLLPRLPPAPRGRSTCWPGVSRPENDLEHRESICAAQFIHLLLVKLISDSEGLPSASHQLKLYTWLAQVPPQVSDRLPVQAVVHADEEPRLLARVRSLPAQHLQAES